MDHAAGKIRDLVVDDSAVMRGMLRSALSSDASLVVAGTAVDGHTAVAAAEDLRPDAILLDVEMPVLDGLETPRRLAPGARFAPNLLLEGRKPGAAPSKAGI